MLIITPLYRTLILSVLRVQSVIPLKARFATKGTVLPVGSGPDGQSPAFVPRGSMIIQDVCNMHHRQDLYFPDADEFQPERWEHLRLSWEYLPFNRGPRVCVGRQYALAEVGYVTVRLAQTYRTLETRNPSP